MERPLKCVGGGSRTPNLPVNQTRLATMLRPSTNVRVQKYKKITSSGQFFKKKIPATVWRYFQQRPDGRWSAPTPPFGHPCPAGKGNSPRTGSLPEDGTDGARRYGANCGTQFEYLRGRRHLHDRRPSFSLPTPLRAHHSAANAVSERNLLRLPTIFHTPHQPQAELSVISEISV